MYRTDHSSGTSTKYSGGGVSIGVTDCLISYCIPTYLRGDGRMPHGILLTKL